ncbi:hypothetical protein [Collinsella aerofaciens]|uniref:hypothetical protein n=1 Tax=Collinsella aerofaciens TaxID=74426 RepID=UPI003D799ECE
MELSRRAFIATVAAGAIGLAGCGTSGQEPSGSAKQEKKPKAKKKAVRKTANVGDAVEVKSKLGKLTITVEGCDASQSLTQLYQDGSEEIADGNVVCALMLIVGNESVKDPDDNDGFEYMQAGIDFTTPDGVSVSPFSSGSDYKGYACALGGWMNAQKGQTDREAVFFQVPDSTQEIIVKLGDTDVTVPITRV